MRDLVLKRFNPPPPPLPLLDRQATHANSSVVRKQFDRKFKLAQSELVFLKKLMLGTDGSSGKDATFTASRVF